MSVQRIFQDLAQFEIVLYTPAKSKSIETLKVFLTEHNFLNPLHNMVYIYILILIEINLKI